MSLSLGSSSGAKVSQMSEKSSKSLSVGQSLIQTLLSKQFRNVNSEIKHEIFYLICIHASLCLWPKFPTKIPRWGLEMWREEKFGSSFGCSARIPFSLLTCLRQSWYSHHPYLRKRDQPEWKSRNQTSISFSSEVVFGVLQLLTRNQLKFSHLRWEIVSFIVSCFHWEVCVENEITAILKGEFFLKRWNF